MMNYNEILNEINKAKKEYYQNGRSHLSDFEYDRLVDQAKKIGYIDTVGYMPVDNIEKIKHEHRMLSLNKVHEERDIIKFINNKSVDIMYKMDGLSISCTYNDGTLVRLETRGNGDIGNDVLFHANSFENLPKKINKSGKYVIDGECVILYSDFEKINENIIEKFSNPRNLAAGSLNQLDPNISKKRHLRFYAWDVINGGESNSLCNNLIEAKELGFDVTYFENIVSINQNDNIKLLLDKYRMSAKQNGIPIDGVVIKYDDIQYGKSLGTTERFGKNAIAYKYSDDRYPTKLIKVEYQIGKTGQLTPVAYIEPIEISGRIIEKCSLHNLSIMKQLQLTKGCTCYVYLANDIIPQIDCAESDSNDNIEIISCCPECGSPVKIIKENNSEVIYCTNDTNCPGRILGLFKTFVSKQGMDIDGLSEETLRKFLKLGYLTNMFVSIYELGEYKKELYKLDGFGKRSIDKLLAAIEASKSVDLQHFLCAFSIDGIGTGQSKLLANKFKTFDEFVSACDNGYNFSQISGIGPILNAAIHKWWVNNHQQMMDVAELVHFITDDFMNPPTGINSPINGKTFCITGSVAYYKNRDELKEEIERLGGKVSGSVSKKTDYLINNNNNAESSKNKKAQELGVQIISEDEYIKLRGPI